MTSKSGQRWNLIFRGQLLPGTEEERARRTLAGFFGLKDTASVAVFFSGKPVALRRNLEREEAQRLYQQLRELGLICELADTATAAKKAVPAQPAPPARPEGDGPKQPAPSSPAAPARNSPSSASPDSPPPPSSPSTPGQPAAAKSRREKPRSDENEARRRPRDSAGRPGGAASEARGRPAADATGDASRAASAAQRSARGAAPNLFSLRPVFDNRPGRKLQEQAQLRALIAAVCALGLVIVVLTVAVRFPAAPADREPIGPLAAATLAGNELLLMLEGALLIHERSGLARLRISAAELGLARFAPPLMADSDGSLLLNGAVEDAPLQIHRCKLELLSCAPAITTNAQPGTLALSRSFTGEHYFLLRADGSLQRWARSGELQASATVQLPWGEASLEASQGLLLLPARDGPLLGVYRPDLQSFGQQLDALLLMPAEAVTSGQDRIRDIAVTDEARWALLDGESAAPGLYRFDSSWGDARPIVLPGAFAEPYLLPWRDKLMIADSGQPLLQRVSADGRLEAPLESELLREERSDWQRLQQQRSLARSLGLILPLALAGLCALAGAIFYTNYCAAKHLPAQRSALLDPMPAGVLWLPPAANREAALRSLDQVLLGGPLLLILLAALLLDGRAALGLLPLAATGIYARQALRRGAGGYLGLVGDRFIAVDYDGRYFYGELVLLRGSSRILLARGLALPIALPGLPNIERAAFNEQVTVARKSAVTEVFGALWMARHPWLRAGVALVAGALLSGACMLLLQG